MSELHCFLQNNLNTLIFGIFVFFFFKSDSCLIHSNTKVVIIFFFLQKDTGRELPPLYPQATFSEFKKNNQDQLFTTDHPVSLQEPGLSISTIFRLAFTEERYHYSIAILALLFLIWLSLSFT